MIKMSEFSGLLILVPLYMAGLLILGGTVTGGVFVFHVVGVPLLFKYSKTFRRSIVFVNFAQWPLHVDYEDPAASGVEGGRNVSIEYQSKVDNCTVKIGVWHILPKTVYEKLKGSFENVEEKQKLDSILNEELAKSKTPIILYCHGNSNSRAAEHRRELYRIFQKLNFHTIAFDYRGYGDSTNLNPSEPGVVEDSLVVYEWIHSVLEKSVKKPPVFVWGHSLGTGISSELVGNLPELSKDFLDRSTPLPLPNGLILESPFSNLADEVATIPLSKLVSWMPYYERTILLPFRGEAELEFKSDEHLKRVPSLPVLILHAKDDIVVPFRVGLKLYRSLCQSRSEGGATVKLHAYDKSEKLGHKWICRANDVADVVGEFVRSHQ